MHNFKDVEVNVKYQMKLMGTPTAKKEVDKLLTHLLQTARTGSVKASVKDGMAR